MTHALVARPVVQPLDEAISYLDGASEVVLRATVLNNALRAMLTVHIAAWFP